MATLNFPDNPDTGDTYSDANSGFEYEWNGTVWISKGASTSGKRSNIQEIDDISGSFNGSNTNFTLNVASNAIEPTDAQQVVISVGGILQNSGDDYTIVGSTITFTTAPADGLTFFGTYVNPYLSVNTVSDNTVSTGSLAASSNYTVGGINVTGVSTLSGLTYTGISSIAALSSSNLAVTGVGTIANVIHTKDSSGLGATIGAAVGVVTYYGDASNMTGIGITLFPYTYSPGIGITQVGVTTNIVTTWSSSIQAGSGTITIRTGGGSGTIVDQFVVGSSSSITIAGDSLTLNPAADLSANTEYFVVYPAGSIQALGGQHQNKQVISNFSTIAESRELWMWGVNGNGQLGQNESGPGLWGGYSSPVQVGTDGNWNKLSASQGSSKTMSAIKTDGTLWSWGYNGGGNLGLNSTIETSSPTQVGTDTTWDDIALQGGLKTDGSLWVWGSNIFGGLGQNQAPANLGYASSPTQIPGTWSAAAYLGAQSGSTAIKTGGTLWVWGYSGYGTLGLNQTAAYYSSPTQIPGTTWERVHVNLYTTSAVKTDGTLWAWGSNTFGELGDNTTVYRSSPTQVGTDTTWGTGEFKLGGGQRDVFAIKTDGTLWTWGANEMGQGGTNTSTDRSSPTQIGTETTWDKVRTANNTSYALKTDGTLWAWGYFWAGSGGVNFSDKRSSPVKIPGTDWDTLGSYSYGGAAIKG